MKNAIKKWWNRLSETNQENNSSGTDNCTPNNVPKKEQDLADYRKSETSSEWLAESHCCINCKCTTTHNEFMSDICNSCGKFNTQKRYERSYRKVFYGGKVQYQVRYRDGREEVIEKWYSI